MIEIAHQSVRLFYTGEGGVERRGFREIIHDDLYLCAEFRGRDGITHQGAHPMSFCDELFNDLTADGAGCAGDKNQ